MCGFAGIVRSGPDGGVDVELLQRMRDTLVHRGPDDAGIYTDEMVGLAFRRLSIIDLTHGGQPMGDSSGMVWVVFNGEIYNYVELRTELEKKGCVFRTSSDTETIVQGYLAYGLDVFRHLNGMFAIAIWDRRAKRLVLARDRAGEKPLHFAQTGEDFVFGSELKALLLHPSVRRELDWEAFREYLGSGYISAPKTIYQGIHSLLPGHYAVLHNGRLKQQPYWTLEPSRAYAGSHEDAVRECRSMLEDAVRIRMRSDVPLGGFLSGGIDSSAVVSLMALMSDRPVRSFTITFGESDFDESRFARLVADRWLTEHVEITLTPHEFLGHVEAVLGDFDQPFGDSSALPTYLVSKVTRQHVTVALSGDGADELFGGYWAYRSALNMQAKLDRIEGWARPLAALGVPLTPRRSKLGRWLRLVRMSREDRYLWGLDLFHPQPRARLEQLLSDAALHETGDEAQARIVEKQREEFRRFLSDPVKGLQYRDLRRYMPDDILAKVDRMSMLASLETRAPFLDHRLIEFAFSLPTEWHVTRTDTKRLLKAAVEDLLPAPIRTRSKMGFAVPVRHWFRSGALRPFYDRIFSSRMARYFNMDTIARYVKQHESGKVDHSGKLWQLLAFSLWLEKSGVSR